MSDTKGNKGATLTNFNKKTASPQQIEAKSHHQAQTGYGGMQGGDIEPADVWAK